MERVFDIGVLQKKIDRAIEFVKICEEPVKHKRNVVKGVYTSSNIAKFLPYTMEKINRLLDVWKIFYKNEGTNRIMPQKEALRLLNAERDRLMRLSKRLEKTCREKCLKFPWRTEPSSEISYFVKKMKIVKRIDGKVSDLDGCCYVEREELIKLMGINSKKVNSFLSSIKPDLIGYKRAYLYKLTPNLLKKVYNRFVDNIEAAIRKREGKAVEYPHPDINKNQRKMPKYLNGMIPYSKIFSKIIKKYKKEYPDIEKVISLKSPVLFIFESGVKYHISQDDVYFPKKDFSKVEKKMLDYYEYETGEETDREPSKDDLEGIVS